jgi:hypothetical protein
MADAQKARPPLCSKKTIMGRVSGRWCWNQKADRADWLLDPNIISGNVTQYIAACGAEHDPKNVIDTAAH